MNRNINARPATSAERNPSGLRTAGLGRIPSAWMIAVALWTVTVPAFGQQLVFRGSDTLGDKMVPELAKVYEAAGNEVQFDIKANGSSAAFDALLDGSAEIGMSSRPIKDSEKKALADAGLEVQEHVAAIDMIAVIVNPANKYDDLKLKDVGRIFTSAVKRWKVVGDIKAYTRNESSGTYKVFQALAMEGKDYGEATTKLESNGDIVAKVAAEPGGVGYVGLSYASADGVKALTINGVAAAPENAETYPLSRKLYFYTIKGKLSSEGEAFIKWVVSDPTAADVVTKVGFIPVSQ